MLTEEQELLLFRVENSMPEPGDLAAIVDLVKEYECITRLLISCLENVTQRALEARAAAAVMKGRGPIPDDLLPENLRP